MDQDALLNLIFGIIEVLVGCTGIYFSWWIAESKTRSTCQIAMRILSERRAVSMVAAATTSATSHPQPPTRLQTHNRHHVHGRAHWSRRTDYRTTGSLLLLELDTAACSMITTDLSVNHDATVSSICTASLGFQARPSRIRATASAG